MSLALDINAPAPRASKPKAVLGLREFNRIQAIMKTDAGITIGDDKVNLVHSRLQKRMRQLGLTDFAEFCDIVENPKGAEERHRLVNSLTTNLTNFFREAHHFQHLLKVSLPPLIKKANSGQRVRIWSAGCSTGQEPYSIAAVLLSMMPDAPNRNIKILASDIDSNVIKKAREGIYEDREIKTLPGRLKDKLFEKFDGTTGDMYIAKPDIKSIIAFRQLNLNAPTWPMKGEFDIIFCRNTVIYFDLETQAKMWTRFRHQMAPDGYLYIGHSERLSGKDAKAFKKVATTTYQLEGQ
jgi:chemotaxis protein methyltransferase CheR